MKRIIVTGATSFLGRNFVESLLDKDYEIYVFVRKESNNPLNIKNEKITYIYGSLNEIEIINDYVTYADVFVHFAWDGSGSQGRNNEKIQIKNVDYSLRALNLSIKLGCEKFIFPGSQAEYGKINDIITETTECNPISPYGKAKLLFSEKAQVKCKNEQIKFIHMRIFSVYGIGDRKGTLVDSCINAFNNGEIMQLGPCSQNWNYLNIKDFIKIVNIFIESNCESGVYNIASPETRILKEFVKIIYDLSNKSGNYEFNTIHADNPEKSPELNPSIKKMKKYLPNDFEFICFKEGIRHIMNNEE